MSQPIPELPPLNKTTPPNPAIPATEQASGEASVVAPIAPGQPYTYVNHIPRLGPSKDHFPLGVLFHNTSGRPGVVYLQAPVSKLHELGQDGWGQTYGSNGQVLPTYRIEGPTGHIDCILLSKGKPIREISPQSSLAFHKLHPDIPKATGLDPVTGLVPTEPEQEESKSASKSK